MARPAAQLGAICAAVLLAAASAQASGSQFEPDGASNTVTLAKARQIRAKLSSAGFQDTVNLQERNGGKWSCRALRFGTTVRVEVGGNGRISIV